MTELHTIEVRYEDETGRHVDVHEAARHVNHPEEYIVDSGVCACCDAERERTVYNPDNVVKKTYADSEHYQYDVDDWKMPWWVPVVFVLALFAVSLLIAAINSGGRIGF